MPFIKRHCALAESVNATLKVDLEHMTIYPTRERHGKILRVGSSSPMIVLVSIRDSDTGLRREVMEEHLNGQETA